MSQFQTLQFSMTLDRWRRERETDGYMLGLTVVFAPSPLGGGARGAPPPHRIGWFCERTRAPLQGVAWAGLWRGGEEGARWASRRGWSSRTLYQYIPNLYQHHTIGYAAAPLANLLTSAARETPTAVHCLGSHQMLSAGRREN